MNPALILGVLTGVAFGFLLQKARVLRFDRQVGAMLLRDMTILKFMLSAIIVGMTGITALSEAGLIALSHKAMNSGALIVGGALFGCGWALMGFCSGTSMCAIGEGRCHAFFALLGMLDGAAIYAEIYPFIKTTVLSWHDAGKISLPSVLGVSPWSVVSIMWIASVCLFIWFEKKRI